MIQQKQKIHNLSRNIKTSIQSFTGQQISLVQSIINTMFSYGYSEGKITDTCIYEIFDKIINKYSLAIEDEQIQFPEIQEFADLNYFAKMYSAFLDKMVSYFSNHNVKDQDFADLFELLDSELILPKTTLKSESAQENEIQIAELRDVIVKDTVVKSITTSSLNSVEFGQGEEQNVQNLSVKLAIGNKQEQIRDSDATTLVDMQTGKQIIREIESDALNKLYK